MNELERLEYMWREGFIVCIAIPIVTTTLFIYLHDILAELRKLNQDKEAKK